MSQTFKQWRDSMIKKYPICKKCGEKTTDKDESMIILGTINKPKVMLPQWYTEHKKCS